MNIQSSRIASNLFPFDDEPQGSIFERPRVLPIFMRLWLVYPSLG